MLKELEEYYIKINGNLNTMDKKLISMLVDAIDTYNEANSIIKEDGVLIKNTRDEDLKNPALFIRSTSYKEIIELCKKLNFLPDKKTINTSEANPLAQFMSPIRVVK